MSEWSRSRFWLSFFLYNRHERVSVRWDQPHDAPPPAAVADWFARNSAATAGLPDMRRPLIARAAARCGDDPAFLQTLRLIVKEEGFHRHLRRRLAQRFVESPVSSRTPSAAWPFLRNLLGLRFELSCLLLADLIEVELHRIVESASRDPVVRTACGQIISDQRAHASCFAERLTMEYADFNFIRRNLRRYRLRGMFSSMLAAYALRHRALLRACGVPLPAFAAACWSSFTATLERMVPYHRDKLMATLLHQRERPYEPIED